MRHRGSAPRVRPVRMVWVRLAAIGLGVGLGLGPAGFLANRALAKVETWRQEGPAAFTKCHRESVVVSDNGRVRLAQAVTAVGSLSAGRVWDLART
ncbi:MAG TPA: hypothetical protein VFF52_19915, partial [Isosphaeraceae bacterium]|nr:hypothetical protein [Isosphaeraceae bacterium]